MLDANDIDYFFGHQITAKNTSYERYQQTTMETLISLNKAFHCEVVSVQDNQQVISKFEVNSSPRDRSYWCALYVPQADLTQPFVHLRDQQATGYTDFTIIRRWKSNDHETLLICEVQDQNFFLAIRKAIEAGRNPVLWIAERLPPLEDLLNTRNFMLSYPQHKVTNYLVNSDDRESLAWDPKPISSAALKDHLTQTPSKLVVVQGPPGTGKSYLAAELLSDALKRQRSVAVVAMSNRALMEIALKTALKEHLELSNVMKTALSSRERRECSKLLAAQELRPIPSKLLLMTVYQATKLFLKPIKFDLLILDEASQVFLPMILGLQKISRQFFVIGDPAQLPPITEPHPKYGELSADFKPLIFGLETVARSVESSEQFILNETYRLLPRAASLTSLFYPTSLISRQPLYTDNHLQEIDFNLGVHLIDLDHEREVFEQVDRLSTTFLREYPKQTIAIISPLIKDVSRLQQRMCAHSSNRLLIETIDRIQGLTVDLCLFVIFEESEFTYNSNRFNVATSRSRGLTVIIRRRTQIIDIHKPLKITRYLEFIRNHNQGISNF